MKKQIAENHKIEHFLNKHSKLNLRQAEALQGLLKYPNKLLNMTSYKNSNEISKMSAIKDLKELVEFVFLREQRKGRNVFYYLTDKIS